MKVHALVAVTLELPDRPWPDDPADRQTVEGMLREEVERRILHSVEECAWCEEAESEVYLAMEGHDPECPMPHADIVVASVQWALGDVDAGLNDEGVTVCQCGSTEFKFEESAPAPRPLVSNENRTLTFEGITDEPYGDGDDQPGVVCEGCGRVVNYDAEIAWQ